MEEVISMRWRKSITTAWYVGLIPALISGAFVYVITRWYERDGFWDGMETAWDQTVEKKPE